MLYKWENLNWQEFGELVPSKIKTALLPIGTIEAHGVISLGADVHIPLKIAEKVTPAIKAVLLPPVYYGVTRTLLPYPGSLTVSSSTFENYILEIAESVADKKISKLVILNGHGGHLDELKNVAYKVHQTKKLKTVVIHWWILCSDITKEVYGQEGAHAGIDETAIEQTFDPKLVQKKRYKKEMAYTVKDGAYIYPAAGSILLYKENQGYPDFDPQKAEVLVNKVSKKITDFVLDVFKRWEKIK